MRRKGHQVWLISVSWFPNKPFPRSQSNLPFPPFPLKRRFRQTNIGAKSNILRWGLSGSFKIISELYNKDHLVIIKGLLVWIRQCGERTMPFFWFVVCARASVHRTFDFVAAIVVFCVSAVLCVWIGIIECWRFEGICFVLGLTWESFQNQQWHCSPHRRGIFYEALKSHPDSTEPPSCLTRFRVNTKYSGNGSQSCPLPSLYLLFSCKYCFWKKKNYCL